MQYQLLPLKASRSIKRAFMHKFSPYDPSRRCGFNGTYHEKLSQSVFPRNVLSFKTATALLSGFPSLYVTWDENANIKKRSLKKASLMCVSGKALVDALSEDGFMSNPNNSLLPDEIFVFDQALTFYVAFTSQYVQGVGNTCLTSLNVIRDNGMPKALRELA